jgi:hypothetical protein
MHSARRTPHGYWWCGGARGAPLSGDRRLCHSPRCGVLLFHRRSAGALDPEAFAEREVRETKNEDYTHCEPENFRCAKVIHDQCSSHISV